MGRRARDKDAHDWLRAVPGQCALQALLPALDGMKCCPAACCSASISPPGAPRWRVHPYLRAHFQLAHLWEGYFLAHPQGTMARGHAGTCGVSPAKLGVPGVQPPAHLQHFCLIGDEGSPARDSLAQGISQVANSWLCCWDEVLP